MFVALHRDAHVRPHDPAAPVEVGVLETRGVLFPGQERGERLFGGLRMPGGGQVLPPLAVQLLACVPEELGECPIDVDLARDLRHGFAHVRRLEHGSEPVRALLKLPCPAPHLPAQRVGPQKKPENDRQQRSGDQGDIFCDREKVNMPVFVHPHPFLVDSPVLTGLIQDLQAFAELGQKCPAPLRNRIAVPGREHRPPAHDQVAPAALLDPVKCGSPRHQRAIVLPPCQLPQGVLLRIHHRDSILESSFQDEIVHDVAPLQHNAPAGQLLDGCGRGAFPVTHHGHVMVDDMRRGEIEDQVPLRRVEHALQRVDLAPRQGFPDLGPGPQTDLDVEPHLPGHGPGEVHVVAGRAPVPVEVLVGGVVVIPADDDGKVGRQLERGEPLGVEVAEGPVGHDQGEPFVQERQGIPVAFADGEAEILAEPFDGPVHDPQVRKPGLPDEPQRHQALGHHSVVKAPGQLVQGLLEGLRRSDADPAIFPPQELLGVVPFHDGHLSTSQVLQVFDARGFFTNHDGSVKGHVGKGKVEQAFPLRSPTHEGQGLDLSGLQPPPHLGPGTGAKGDLPAHGAEGRPHQLDGKAPCAALLVHDGKGRVVDLCRRTNRIMFRCSGRGCADQAPGQYQGGQKDP